MGITPVPNEDVQLLFLLMKMQLIRTSFQTVATMVRQRSATKQRPNEKGEAEAL